MQGRRGWHPGVTVERPVSFALESAHRQHHEAYPGFVVTERLVVWLSFRGGIEAQKYTVKGAQTIGPGARSVTS